MRRVGNDEEQKNSIGNQLKEAGKEEIKKKGKEVAKKILKKALPYIAGVLLALVLASCLMAVVNILVEGAQGIINAIVDAFKGDQTAIEISDEKLDELIKIIEETGIDLEDLELLRRD